MTQTKLELQARVTELEKEVEELNEELNQWRSE